MASLATRIGEEFATLRNNELSLKADIATTYTKTECDTNFEPKDLTILKDADIGVNVEAYDANILKHDGSGNLTLTGYLAGPTTFTIDPAVVGDNTGKVIIAGDLQVDGTTTTVNSTEISIDDLTMVLAANATDGATANGGGLILGNGSIANFTYNNANTAFASTVDMYANGAKVLTTASATEILTAIKTVDGAGSGLNADQLDAYNQSAAATANTIARRDASADLYANIFQGQATSAQYADLGEKYTCENEALPTGTLVCACTEGEYEAQECMQEKCGSVIGVVSDNPAVRMNDGLTNSVMVGLTGKVPVRVIGAVEKGKPLVSAGNGCARQAKDDFELIFKIGVTLESNDNANEKLVFSAIK